jgi:hypothetical protein
MKMKRFFAPLFAALALFSPLAALGAGVSVNLNAQITGAYNGSNALGSVAFSLNQVLQQQLAPGTASGQADKLFSDRRTLAASATENLDLAGVLVDPLGSTLTFGHVKWIYVKASTANTNNVCVGGAATNAFAGPFADPTDIVCIQPGGIALFTVNSGVGWTVTPSTGDLLKMANSAGTTGVTYDIIVAGTST